MSSSLAFVLSALTASASSEPAVSTNRAKLSSEATPSDNSHEVKGVTTNLPPALPKKGTLTAWQFLAIASNANVNWAWEENPSCHTTGKDGASRDAMIQAISAYCGWDVAKDFGTQDVAARLKAQREIQPRPINPRPTLTLAGLVAGMPDFRQKAIADLQGRERCAVEAMLAFSKVTCLVTFGKAVENHCDGELSPKLLALATEANFRELAEGLVKDEQGRLADARKGLAAYFG
jgi:hypothetical protein